MYRVRGADPAKHYWHHEPVVAFDDDGTPLVVGRAGLRRATDDTNFDHVGAEEIYTSVIPGGGWLVDLGYRDGGRSTVPVLAWAFTAASWAIPVLCFTDGDAEPFKFTDYASVRFWHPDEAHEDPPAPFGVEQ